MSANRCQAGEEIVPGFRLDRFVGAGGFGEVWQATGPGGTKVAIKRIVLDVAGLKELRSLELVKHIRHPNLTPLLACWVKNDQGDLLDDAAIAAAAAAIRGTLVAARRPAELVLAMGLGEKNLLDRLHECVQTGLKGIPIEELLDYIEDAARGLDYLNGPRPHLTDIEDAKSPRKGAVQHCDVKPQNIVLVGAAAQVCDFGMARLLDDARLTSPSASLSYVAPECADGRSPSRTTDQYSLAISYVELRTGRLPFDESLSARDVLRVHLLGQLDLSALPPAERRVIQRATSLTPQERYPTCLHMARALRQAWALSSASDALGQDRDFAKEPTIERGRSTRRRVALLAVTLGAFLGLVSVLTLSLLVGRPDKPLARGRAPREAARVAPTRPQPVRVTRWQVTPSAKSAVAPPSASPSEPSRAVAIKADAPASMTRSQRLAGVAAARWLRHWPARQAGLRVASASRQIDRGLEIALDATNHWMAAAQLQLADWRSAQESKVAIATEAPVEAQPSPAAAWRRQADWHAAAGQYELALAEYEKAALASSAAWDRLACQLRLRVNANGAAILVPGSALHRLAPGQIVRVTRASGDWLWVEVEQLDKLPRDRKPQSGWISRRDVTAEAPRIAGAAE